MKTLESTRDFLSMMHTCRTLYRLGVPFFLTNIVYTHSQNQHMIYRHLLLSDPSRFEHIAVLACDYMDFPYANAASPSLFLDLLRLATRLQSLDLNFNPGIEIKDDIIFLIGDLPKLRILNLRACPVPVLSRLMPRIKVPLTGLGLHQEDLASGSSANHTPFNPFPFISPFRDSLTSLWLGAYAPISIPPSMPGSQALVFPRIELLEWHSHSTYDTSTFARMFPAVRYLDVSLPTPATIWEEAAVSRERNLGGPQWPTGHKMQHVCGGPRDLWILGLRCRAERLELTIRDLQQTLFVTNVMAPTVIRDLSPTSLKLNLSAPCSTLMNGDLQAFVHEGLHELEIQISLVSPFLLFAVSILVRPSSAL